MDPSAFWGIASIVATVVFSGIGIFLGVTVKRERIRKSMESILDTFFTMVVNEKKVPSRDEITKLGKLKCSENKIKLSKSRQEFVMV